MLSWSRFDLGLTLCSLPAPMDDTTSERLLELNTMRRDAHASEIGHRAVRGKSIGVSWLRLQLQSCANRSTQLRICLHTQPM
jgi:hypothetical protein